MRLKILFSLLFVVAIAGTYVTTPAQTNTTEYVSEAEYFRFRQKGERLSKLDAPSLCPSCCQWTTPAIVDTSSSDLQAQTYAALAVDDSGNLVAAWMDSRSGGGNQIVVERSTNKGQTWTRSVPYNYAYLRIVRDIAFDHIGNLWMLWTTTTGEFQPFFLNLSKSTDNGQTFTTVFTAREYAGAFFESKLAIDRSNNVFILWPDQQFKLTRFTNGNIIQRIDTEIPNDTLSVDFWCSLALGTKADVYCVWAGARTSGGRLAVFCSTSRDTGISFAATVELDTTQRAQRFPSCTVDDSGRVYVAYSRTPSVNVFAILLSRSLDFGLSFEPGNSVIDSGYNTNPVACVDASNGLNLLWSGDGGGIFQQVNKRRADILDTSTHSCGKT